MLKKAFLLFMLVVLEISDYRARKRGRFDKKQEDPPTRFNFIYKNATIPQPCATTFLRALGEVCEDTIPELGAYPAHRVGYSPPKRFGRTRTFYIDDTEIDLNKIAEIVHKETNNPSEYIPMNIKGFSIPDGIEAFVNGVRITRVAPPQEEETIPKTARLLLLEAMAEYHSQ